MSWRQEARCTRPLISSLNRGTSLTYDSVHLLASRTAIHPPRGRGVLRTSALRSSKKFVEVAPSTEAGYCYASVIGDRPWTAARGRGLEPRSHSWALITRGVGSQ